jgi:hypothetical protein
MNDLSVDDKALIVMFLLTMLREYREKNRGQAGELVHVTVVEEAHNVLENVTSKGSGEGATSADTRFKAVEAFCQLLTEIRALGEGLVIADQSPEKLARDALRNTNLQIAHQLRDGRDREAIANAMIMEKEQRDFLGKLPPGQAAMFRTGLEKATFVRFEKYYPTQDDLRARPPESSPTEWNAWRGQFRGLGFRVDVSDDELAAMMRRLSPSFTDLRSLSLPYQGCQFCRAQCRYRDAVFPLSRHSEFQSDRASWHRSFVDEGGISKTELRALTASLVTEILRRGGIDHTDCHAAWCVFVHMWSEQFRHELNDKEQSKAYFLDEEVYRDFVGHFRNSTPINERGPGHDRERQEEAR